MKRLTVLFLCVFLITAALFRCAHASDAMQKRLRPIIPKPVSAVFQEGTFTLSPATGVYVGKRSEELRAPVDYFLEIINRATGYSLRSKGVAGSRIPPGSIVFQLSEKESSLGKEGYTLDVTAKTVTITAYKSPGLFYGVQTILQLLPPQVFDTTAGGADIAWTLPCVQIKDKPRFPYRGMHLDVSRHFFPKDFILRFIDLIAMHKMNVFHWHLTDDQGWRIEIKRYPKLAELSAWRADRQGVTWREREPQAEDEEATYGGFYTQDEIREVVSYAAQRNVTVIPEIEMPGHSSEVFAAYPELSCTGERLTVRTGHYWPNVDIFCAGNDSVFRFLENVLTEVIALFPGGYIHIGGDEANKERWKECPKCQARITAEHLKNEEELQSYFIRRIEKFLLSKKRSIIGWDEILEGGLAPGATVMSWRGVEGGIAAAKMGHDVIMTPVSHCYFDYYQADPQSEPEAIGGYTTLKKVYSFEPIPAALSEKESAFVLGAQGNVWTEYTTDPASVEYMSLPRMAALAEVVWSPKESRDWSDFRVRLEDQFKRFEAMGVSFSKGSFAVEVKTSFEPTTGTLMGMLETEQVAPLIHYTRDGEDPTPDAPRYTGPFPVKEPTTVKAGIFIGETLKERMTEKIITPHAAVGRGVKYRQPFSDRYTSTDRTLVNGLRGSLNHADGEWQAFLQNDVDVVIDLGARRSVSSVKVSLLKNEEILILLPERVEIGVSEDGELYTLLSDVGEEELLSEGGASTHAYGVQPDEPVSCRYVRVRAKNPGLVPEGNPGAGEPAWLFVDEIMVE